MQSKSTETQRSARADYMRSYYRDRGAEPIKGEYFICDHCGKSCPKTGHSQKWCPLCKPEALRLYSIEKRQATGTISIGSVLQCKHCGTAAIKRHKRQFYCGPCSILSAQSELPGQKQGQIEYQKRRNKRLREENPSFAISERITAQIGQALRGRKAGRKWESIVGYGIDELMAHIERQFLKGMSWDNRADWHLDHVVPISSFTFTGPDDPEIRRAWALPNLRPLWAADNIRKSGSRTHLL